MRGKIVAMRVTVAAAVALLAIVTRDAAAQDITGKVAGTGQGKTVDLSGKVVDLVYQVKDLNYVVQDMGGKVKNLEVKETKTEIKIDLAADVLFDFDKSTLRPSAKDALHQAASIIKANASGRDVKIDGYTDSKGSDPYNQRLSDRRAASVKKWLIAKEGLSDVRFVTRGFGAKNPVAPNTKPDGSDNPDGRQKNRRVEIIVEKG